MTRRKRRRIRREQARLRRLRRQHPERVRVVTLNEWIHSRTIRGPERRRVIRSAGRAVARWRDMGEMWAAIDSVVSMLDAARKEARS